LTSPGGGPRGHLCFLLHASQNADCRQSDGGLAIRRRIRAGRSGRYRLTPTGGYVSRSWRPREGHRWREVSFGAGGAGQGTRRAWMFTCTRRCARARAKGSSTMSPPRSLGWGRGPGLWRPTATSTGGETGDGNACQELMLAAVYVPVKPADACVAK
jgi:hypothetical protein